MVSDWLASVAEIVEDIDVVHVAPDIRHIVALGILQSGPLRRTCPRDMAHRDLLRCQCGFVVASIAQ